MAGLSNPVPLGRAGTGAATIFGSGTQALNYLINSDAQQAAIQARTAAAAQRQKDQEYKDFMSRVKLTDEGGVHYQPLLQSEAQKTFQTMEKLAVDPTLNRAARGLAQAQEQDKYNRMAKASLKNDTYVADLARRVTADKRFDTDKTTRLLHDTLYRKKDDGSQEVLSPLDYDPQAADTAVNTGNGHLNGVEVFKTYLRGSHPDAVTSAREALPGGKGFRNVASSDVYELTDNGKIKYDAHTNLPVVKATPQSLNYFDSDPVSKQWLDGEELKHQAQFTGAVEKMKNSEQLTPEEAEAVRIEQSPEGRRMEVFKNGLLQQGYGRQSTTILAKAAPRPRAAASAKAPKFTQAGGAEFTPGVLGATGVNGTAGAAHFGQTAPLTRTSSTGKVEQYSGNATFRDYLLQVGDGSPIQHITNNTKPQNLTYGGQVTFLKKPNGTIIFPHDPAIIKAADEGNDEPLKAWAKQERAKDPRLTYAYYQSATPAKNADLTVGSEDEMYEQIKEANSAKAKLESSTLTKEERHDLELKAAKFAAMDMGSGPSKGKAPLTEGQMRAMARKLYGDQSAVMHVPYSGANKLQIDAQTGYGLRDKKLTKQRQDYIDALERDTRPGANEQRQATAGRGPLAGLVVPAPATRAAPKAATPPATSNKYGFKFKK